MANKHCPICGEENKCMTEAGENSNNCWCTTEDFPKEIFELVPEESIRKHCICINCLTTFKEKNQLGQLN